MNDNELNNEIRGLNNDKKIFKLTLESHQNKIANDLKGSMGKDMMDVLQGKTFVKLSKWEKFKYKINYYIDNILKIF